MKLLSISVITYNRVGFLVNIINSIVNQVRNGGFQDKIELVISDNCSSDSTEEFMLNSISTNNDINIVYNRNEVNLGAVRNLTKALECSTSRYWMFFGDDDLLAPNGLKNIIEILEKNLDQPTFLFNSVQEKIFKDGDILKLTISEVAQKHFYYFGNAGVFAIKTDLAKMALSIKYDSIISTCWPQTEIGFRVMVMSGELKSTYCVGIESSDSPNHSANSIYNSWYLYETPYFALIRLAINLTDVLGKNFINTALKGIPLAKGTSLIKSIFLYSTFSDSADENRKAIDLIKSSLHYLEGEQKFKAHICKGVLILPQNVKKLIIKTILLILNPRTFKKNYEKLEAKFLKKVSKKNEVSNYTNMQSIYGE